MNNTLININGIFIEDRKEYAIALRNAYERLKIGKWYANTYYNFYIFKQNTNDDILFITKVEINDTTKDYLLSFIEEYGGMVDVNR